MLWFNAALHTDSAGSCAGSLLLRVPEKLLLSGRSARADVCLAKALDSQLKPLSPTQVTTSLSTGRVSRSSTMPLTLNYLLLQ